MTTQQITTKRTIINPPAWEVLQVARDWKRQADVAVKPSPCALAQSAGDALYAWTMEATGDGEQAAVNYHLEYQTVARELGCGPGCGCDLCRDEFGTGGAQ